MVCCLPGHESCDSQLYHRRDPGVLLSNKGLGAARHFTPGWVPWTSPHRVEHAVVVVVLNVCKRRQTPEP